MSDIEKADKIALVKQLRDEFWNYPKTVGWNISNNNNNSSSSSGNNNNNYNSNSNSSNKMEFPSGSVPSDAIHGNFLEAINTSLNILDKHYMDRDLQKTNNSIVMISASNGIFKVKHNLSQITKQRMLDNAFGLDFISLSRPIIETVPLFLVDSKSDGVQNFYEIPHWMRISYIDCEKEVR